MSKPYIFWAFAGRPGRPGPFLPVLVVLLKKFWQFNHYFFFRTKNEINYIFQGPNIYLIQKNEYVLGEKLLLHNTFEIRELMQEYYVEIFLSFSILHFVFVWCAHRSICNLSSAVTHVILICDHVSCRIWTTCSSMSIVFHSCDARAKHQ